MRRTVIIAAVGLLALGGSVGQRAGALGPSCAVSGIASAPVPGDRTAEGTVDCSVDLGQRSPAFHVEVHVTQNDRHPVLIEDRRSVDLDGDGQDDASDGGGRVDVECPPPEARGPVTAVACPVVEQLP